MQPEAAVLHHRAPTTDWMRSSKVLLCPSPESIEWPCCAPCLPPAGEAPVQPSQNKRRCQGGVRGAAKCNARGVVQRLLLDGSQAHHVSGTDCSKPHTPSPRCTAAGIHPADILLQWAAQEGDTPKAAELLRAGADPTAKVGKPAVEA